MTLKRMVEKRIGKAATKGLPARIRKHFDRMENLPTPQKKISTAKILKVVGA